MLEQLADGHAGVPTAPVADALIRAWTSTLPAFDSRLLPGVRDTLGYAATSAWNVVTMKLGLAPLVTVAIGASALLGATAQCPDFTTYSQVGRIGKEWTTHELIYSLL